MRRRLRRRLGGHPERGLTLVELLVAAAISVIIVGAATTMLISAVKTQPKISQRAQDVSKARYVLERMTREIRNGLAVDQASSSAVSFRTRVRRTSCGGGVPPASSSAIVCQVTYTCDVDSCARIEAAPGVFTGTATTIFTGTNSDNVFNFSPGTEAPSFVGVTLRFPNPDGGGSLTISDGANLRNTSVFGS